MIPEQARLEIIRKKQEGETWTGIANWIEDEYGISIHRTTVQRWYDREAFNVEEVGQDEPWESIEDKTKLDKKLATYKSEVAYYKKLYQSVISSDAKTDLIIEAINYMTNHFNNVCTLTLGKCMFSKNLDPIYIPVWLSVKLPIIILVGLILLPLTEKKIFISKKNYITFGTLLVSSFFSLLSYLVPSQGLSKSNSRYS